QDADEVVDAAGDLVAGVFVRSQRVVAGRVLAREIGTARQGGAPEASDVEVVGRNLRTRERRILGLRRAVRRNADTVTAWRACEREQCGDSPSPTFHTASPQL